jgi:hypothetical protein
VRRFSDLVKFTETPYLTFNNSGLGYAKGLDLFWRDGKINNNLEYWVSYSYIDTERDYKN